MRVFATKFLFSSILSYEAICLRGLLGRKKEKIEQYRKVRKSGKPHPNNFHFGLRAKKENFIKEKKISFNPSKLSFHRKKMFLNFFNERYIIAMCCHVKLNRWNAHCGRLTHFSYRKKAFYDFLFITLIFNLLTRHFNQ